MSYRSLIPTNLNSLVEMAFGSQVYGTNLSTSDTDIKIVFLPPARDILLQQVKKSSKLTTKQDDTQKNSLQDIEIGLFSLQEYIRLLLKGQTMALDMLFTPDRHVYRTSWQWEWIRTHREKFLHEACFWQYPAKAGTSLRYGVRGSRLGAVKRVLEALSDLPEEERLEDHWKELSDQLAGVEFVQFIPRPDLRYQNFLEVCGRKVTLDCKVKYARQVFQRVFDKYGERARQAETNQGIDWEALMHAVRVLYEAQELLLTHQITFPRPEATLLLQIRKGELSYQEVAEMIENGVEGVRSTVQWVSTLPEKPDYAFAEQFVLEEYCKVVCSCVEAP